MNPSLKKWLNMSRIVLSIPFLAVGVFSFAWSLVSFAGGPDGRIGSPAALGYGTGFLLFSLLCGSVFWLLNGRKRRAVLTLGCLYEGIVVLLTLVYLIGCISILIEYRLWSFPAFFLQLILWCIILAGGYGLFRLMKKNKEPKQ